MKEIKIIKLVSFLLFVIPTFALFFILLTTNHLVSYTSLDLPIGTVKAQLHRSREQLFKIMSGSRDAF